MNLVIKRQSKKPVIVGLFVLFCLLVSGYYFSLAFFAENLSEVQVTQVRKQELISEIETSGFLQCAEQQEFYACTNSTVKEIRKKEGERVTLGEAILLLDNSHVLRALGQAENNLAILQNDYLEAVSEKVYLMNKRDEARQKQAWLEAIWQIEEIPYDEVESARTAVMELEDQIKAVDLVVLENQVERGRLAVQAAREELADTVVLSPFEGTVLQMAVKCGEPVNREKFLFSVGKMDFWEAEAFITEYDVLKVQEGNQVEIVCEAQGDKIYSGKIAQIVPLTEARQTPEGLMNMVKLKIALPEKMGELRSGSTVRVKIPLTPKTPILLVPRQAIIEEEGESFIFVYENGLAQKRLITKGMVIETEQEIVSGLQEGETIIISSREELYDQQKVKINGSLSSEE